MGTALITWASSGIGKDLAYIHAENLWNLVLVARSNDDLQEVKKDIESKYSVSVLVLAYDLTETHAAKEIYDTIKSEKIEIEYLINNAWFGGVGKFYEREWSQDKNMILLNILALTELTRLFLPDFVAKNSGRIMNTSSTASLLAGPNQAVYFASKAFVTSFSNAINEELYDKNVTVTALLPWATDTGFWSRSGMDRTKMFQNTASSREVAETGYEAMMQGKRNVLAGVGFAWKILMYLIPFIPKSLLLSQIRKAQETNT